MGILDTIDREGRFGEWLAALAMLAIGAVLALPGDTMMFSEWWALRDFGLREVTIGYGLGAIGGARMVALYVNGAWHRTPLLRGIGAVIGMMVFSGLALASAWAWCAGLVSAPDMNFAFYLIFALADLRGVYRAGMDHDAARFST